MFQFHCSFVFWSYTSRLGLPKYDAKVLIYNLVYPPNVQAHKPQGKRIMSAVGTILLQSPGWNEGKARYETLGKWGHKKLGAPSGAALTASVWFVALHSLGKCRPYWAL